MIRMVLGFLLMMGAVGGIEQDTATITEGLTLALVGVLLMVWALPTVIEKGEV
jgi:hypothetical protein